MASELSIGKLNTKASGTGDVVYVESSDGSQLAGIYQESDGRAALNVRDAAGIPKVNLDSDGVSYFNGGNLGINNAEATPSATQAGFEFTSDQLYTSAGASTSTNYQVRFYNGNGLVGSIVTDGSATAFNTSSDYRLKENVTALTGALDRLDSIPVYNFNFKADPSKTVDGFLAHEVAEFVPEAISGEKDEMETVVVTKAVEAVEAVAATLYVEGDELPDGVAIGDEKTPAVEAVEAVAEVTEEQPKYQGIDQSKLVPLLVAAVKELKAKVTALENA